MVRSERTNVIDSIDRMRSNEPRALLRTSARSGTATLELVICLPILVAMAALIIAVASGAQLSGQTAIESRVMAFQTADTNHTDQNNILLMTVNMFDRDIVTGGAQGQVSVPPVLGSPLLSASSQTRALHNGWDYQELPLDNPLHVRLYEQVARAVGIGEINGILSELQSLASFSHRGATLAEQRLEIVQIELPAVAKDIVLLAVDRSGEDIVREGLEQLAAGGGFTTIGLMGSMERLQKDRATTAINPERRVGPSTVLAPQFYPGTWANDAR